MTTTDAMLIGALVAAVAYAIGTIAWRTYKAARKFLRELMNTFRESTEAMKGLEREFAHVRYMTTGGMPQAGPEAQGMQVGGDPASPLVAPRGTVSFPTPAYDRFQVVEEHDAETDDTSMEMLNQTDRDLAQIEHIENMRDRGIEVEPDDAVHPGVEVDAE